MWISGLDLDTCERFFCMGFGPEGLVKPFFSPILCSQVILAFN
jgi:hypothetical protein